MLTLSGANSQTLVGEVRLANCRTPPATVSFVLSDSESDPADVEVTCSSPSGGKVLIAALRGLATSPAGTRHSVEWDFSKEFGIGFTPGIAVSVAVAGAEPAVLAAQACGNDAPVIADVRPPPGDEVVGIAQIDFTVRDSSDDPVSIRAEYRVVGADAEGDWQPAKPAGSALRRVQAPRDGTELSFFWDVVEDTGHVVEEVLLRISADDDLELSHPVETPPFRINNNQAPIAIILASDLQANPDQRRGIPIRFKVRDANRDAVRVLFQWRGSGEAFPELPTTVVDLDKILASPALRRRYHIASERPRTFEGRVTVPDPEDDPAGARVRLMELAMTASPLLAAGMVGREIEIPRSSEIPSAAGGSWELRAPVAAVPLGDGIRAVVLDRPSPGSWRLQEVDLGSGEVVRPIAESTEGDPDALALEPDGGSVLIAVDLGGAWKVLRVDLESGKSPVLLFTAAPPLEPGPVRGMAVLGTEAALVTAGGSLICVQTSNSGTSRAATVLGGLKTPWGIAVDPLRPGQVYLAERDWPGAETTGRVLALDLNTLARRTIPGFERPEALALERKGGRLLAVTSPGGSGRHALRGLDAGAGAGDVFAIGGDLEGAIGGLATGPDGLRVLALTSVNDLAVGGGVASRRTVKEFNVSIKEATVDPPFRPRLENQMRWRIRDRLLPVSATPEGVQRTFVWDSGDVPQGGDVALRAVALDAGIGIPEDVNDALKTVKGIFSTPPQILGGTDSTPLPQALAAADLNGDGRVDLVSANYTNVTVFFQKDRGLYPSQPDLTLAGFRGARGIEAADLDGDAMADLAAVEVSTLKVYFKNGPGAFAETPDATLPGLRGPRTVAAGDLDGDGDLDLVVADTNGNSVAVFRQRENGSRTFEAWKVLSPAVPGVPSKPASVALGDLNGDGFIDIVSANEASNNLTVFFQGPGGFPDAPSLRLRDVVTTQGPESVVAADLNGDGRNDLASANKLSGSVTLFFQKGEGVYSQAPDVSLTGLQGPRALAVSDLDGDGTLDLVSSNVEGNNCTVLFQGDRGAFDVNPAVVLLDSQAAQRPNALLVRDLDGDGRPELVTASALAHDLTVLENGRGGEFSSQPDLILGGPTVTRTPRFLAQGDLDGDGDLDIVCANETALDITVFLQKRPGVFEVQQTLKTGSTGNQYDGVEAVDLDGDGRLEIVAQNGHTPFHGVYFQKSPGVFEETPSLKIKIAHDAGTGQIISADLDRDGLLDIVSSEINYTGIFFQERPKEFAKSEDLPTAPWGCAAGDFNGDGELDLAVSNEGISPLMLFFQSGSRRFSTKPELEFGGPPIPPDVTYVPIDAQDLDSDGRLDLISSQPTTVSVLFNAGPPSFFGLPDLYLGGSGMTDFPRSVASGDLDGDGSLDIASANSASDSVTLFFQRAPRVFPEVPDVTLSGTAGPFCVLLLDLDGDGDLDLVVSNSDGNNVAVFYGSH